MLLGNFFLINHIEHSPESDMVQVSFNAAHEIFKGHFPHLPVVPGVCQMQMLEEVVSHIAGSEFRITEAGQVKFLALLNPVKSQSITLEINRKAEDSGLNVTARYYDQAETFFRFKGKLNATS